MSISTMSLDAPLGVRVDGVDLNEISDQTVEEIEAAVLEHALVLFRRQALSDLGLERLSARFGALETPANDTQLSPQTRHVVYISNLCYENGEPIGALGNDDVRWHADQAFRAKPATLAILYAMHVASSGGDTLWCSTRLGYRALPATLQARIEALWGTYRPSAMHTIEKREVSHPVVLTVPGERGRALYVSPGTRGFVGMDDGQAKALRDELLAFQLRPEHIYRHVWQSGDVVIYDNGQTLHRRDAFEGLRFMKATRVFVSPERFPVPD